MSNDLFTFSCILNWIHVGNEKRGNSEFSLRLNSHNLIDEIVTFITLYVHYVYSYVGMNLR